MRDGQDAVHGGDRGVARKGDLVLGSALKGVRDRVRRPAGRIGRPRQLLMQLATGCGAAGIAGLYAVTAFGVSALRSLRLWRISAAVTVVAVQLLGAVEGAVLGVLARPAIGSLRLLAEARQLVGRIAAAVFAVVRKRALASIGTYARSDLRLRRGEGVAPGALLVAGTGPAVRIGKADLVAVKRVPATAYGVEIKPG
jgi:hypothetical protein